MPHLKDYDYNQMKMILISFDQESIDRAEKQKKKLKARNNGVGLSVPH